MSSLRRPEGILDLMGHEIAGTRLKCATLGLNTTKEAGAAVVHKRHRRLIGTGIAMALSARKFFLALALVGVVTILPRGEDGTTPAGWQ